MIRSLILSVSIIVFLMLGWTVVQTLWRKVFTGSSVGEDVLADRRSCANCTCSNTTCVNNEKSFN